MRTRPGLRGARAETLARRHLEKAGLRCLTRNYRSRRGEIDLVMQAPPGQLVFVEVRYRGRDDFGSPLESVTPSKCRRVRQAAEAFLAAHPRFAAWACRFDVVALSPGTDRKGVTIEWLQNAF